VHAELRRALNVVERDMVATAIGKLDVRDGDWTDRSLGQTGAVMQGPYGTAQGVSVIIGESPNAQLVSVADQVQEFVHEAILWYGGRPVVWPECPQHPDSHPLAAIEDPAHGPSWACPRSGEVIAAIGGLAA
jgi:hypothetical protein